ncbi:GNAT family N-acetyltransferase [Actinoplanes sp. M2I2]|uniref:GNAT family N-acetyltransferase n=1 Tax=Actinoplanes sp. M2I2 TaxID=1734444 RepID=UPI002021BC46|nr:GNAT family N-acetyltransferase [Actinoplanes sp. M2I2]
MDRLPAVTLVPFTAELVQVWFTDTEVGRWLGGPDWPARALRLRGHGIGEIYRGRRVLRDHTWVALDSHGDPVALTGGDVYDPGPELGLAYVVDPARWRQGYGTATLLALIEHPAVADVAVFTAGIEPANVASSRCAAAAGFRPDDPEPDFEGIVHHVLRRHPDDHGGAVG